MLSIVSNPRSSYVTKSYMANKMLVVWKQGFKTMTWIRVWTHLGFRVFKLFAWRQLWVGSVFNGACCVCCLVFSMLQIFAILGNLGVFEKWRGCYGKLMEQCVMEELNGGTKELVEDMQLREGIFKLETKYTKFCTNVWIIVRVSFFDLGLVFNYNDTIGL